MEIKGKVHLFFEQSGVFKNEFKKLGYDASDYDIQNNFGQTDHVTDLFAEIEKAYEGGQSIFDNIGKDDLIMAFFPCVYFTGMNTMFFDGTNTTIVNYPQEDKVRYILDRGDSRHRLWSLAMKMFFVCDKMELRLIVENPYSKHHYLHNNFPYKPAYIDMNRRRRGDYFIKPTQYWFVNCTPTEGFTRTKAKMELNVTTISGHSGSMCDEERSMISPDYARNFICDNILGKSQPNICKTLFDN